jgi:ribosomal-protein-serine acetyltransferase
LPDIYDEKMKTIRVNDQIELREIALSDAMDIFKTIDAQRYYLGKWLPFVETTRKVEDTEAFIRSILETPPKFREYTFVIHYNRGFAGLIGFKSTDQTNRKTEIGYWLSERYQKNGIITESLKSLMALAYNELNMNRIQIKCAVGNSPSNNIPKRLGFKFEGFERDGELLSGDVYTDIAVYSKLKNDE